MQQILDQKVTFNLDQILTKKPQTLGPDIDKMIYTLILC